MRGQIIRIRVNCTHIFGNVNGNGTKPTDTALHKRRIDVHDAIFVFYISFILHIFQLKLSEFFEKQYLIKKRKKRLFDRTLLKKRICQFILPEM